jgi:hypothetical protein
MVNTHAMKETIWITKLMKKLGYMKKKKVTVIQCDNQSAISLIKNPTQHTWTKHIDVKHHFVKKKWKYQDLFEYYSTEDMAMDVLTKAL